MPISEFHKSKSESFHHKAIKRYVYNQIKNSKFFISELNKEKYFKNHRADIFFKCKNDKKVIIEIQNSKISTRDLIHRTEDYNNLGMYVLWILNGLSPVVAEFKFPINKINKKISSVEKILHRMYGGRVYYINIDSFADHYSISQPFALHYSISNKKPVKAQKSRYGYYYIRNSNFSKIPNWNILCTEFNGFKIARFYDKHVKSTLREDIGSSIEAFVLKNSGLDLNKKRNTKKLIKYVIRKYRTNYGIPLILECFDKLDNRFDLKKQVLERYNNKLRYNRK